LVSPPPPPRLPLVSHTPPFLPTTCWGLALPTDLIHPIGTFILLLSKKVLMAQDANAHLNGTGSDGDGDSEVAESGQDDDNELDDEEDEELDDDYLQQLAKEARRLKVAVHMAVSCLQALSCVLALYFVHSLLTSHEACINQDLKHGKFC